MIGMFQSLLESGGLFLVNLGKAGVRELNLLLGNVLFWRILTGIVVIVALFAWGKYLKFKSRFSIRKLKRLNRLRRSEQSLTRSGLILNPSLSGSLSRRGKREALSDLAEIVGPLRDSLKLLKQNALKDTKIYNDTFKEALVLQREFANQVHTVALTGIDISTDPFNEEYDEAINQLKVRKSDKAREGIKLFLKKIFQWIPGRKKVSKPVSVAPSESE